MKLSLKTIVIFAVAILSGILLLYTSQAVQDAERRLANMRADLNSKQSEIRMLQAEWAFLSAPERLQKIAEDDLGLSMDIAPVAPTVDAILQSQETQKHDASYQKEEP